MRGDILIDPADIVERIVRNPGLDLDVIRKLCVHNRLS